jgi:3-isopropylmalate/(R)-2-methylmalate dehydratase small subunit
MRKSELRGRLWVLTDPQGQLYDDVDTDQIYHNRHLHLTDLSEMGKHALGNLAGWERFPESAQPGDILVAGRNFGAGSSRQQAVDCFIALGVAAVVAESFGAIYKRNAINSGFPVVEAPGLAGRATQVATGDVATLDLRAGGMRGSQGVIALTKPFSRVQMDIYLAGDLFAYGRLIAQDGVLRSSREQVPNSGGA